MYEKTKKPTAQRKGAAYILLGILVCVALIGTVVATAVWGIFYINGFRTYTGQFSRSTVYAYEKCTMVAKTQEETFRIRQDNVYPIYTAIINAGPGRMGTSPNREPELVLEFGDGAQMRLWMVELKNPIRDRSSGLFITYTGPDGTTYSYDTDKLDIAMLPLDRKENLPNKSPERN